MSPKILEAVLVRPQSIRSANLANIAETCSWLIYSPVDWAMLQGWEVPASIGEHERSASVCSMRESVEAGDTGPMIGVLAQDPGSGSLWETPPAVAVGRSVREAG